MMKTLRSLTLAALLAMVAAASPVYAQATLNSTTLSAAIDAAQTTITVASATNVAANYILFVDQEAMRVISLTGTQVRVVRGHGGTGARAHSASAVIYTGPATYYSANEVVPGSTCTSTAEVALPRIVLPTGNVYQCTNSIWYALGSMVGAIQASFVQGATPADALDTIFFLADRDYVLVAVSAVWGTAETTGSMDIMVEKLTGTTACASGTDLLSAAIAATGTANTVTAGALVTTASAHLLSAGGRLCVDLSATPNEVANMVVTATLVPR
jgi:hypothetical protein